MFSEWFITAAVTITVKTSLSTKCGSRNKVKNIFSVLFMEEKGNFILTPSTS
ncbi:hypothetical protein EXN66_Car022034 [Channa argus]|uniref:Uncharacterized protein n=1 Tax=Channa argus TaxID=215402 RepID=A0A6G1QUR0_CHAAH|nr:hypothetical protein EXN66_Car022034 [Channa argus]